MKNEKNVANQLQLKFRAYFEIASSLSKVMNAILMLFSYVTRFLMHIAGSRLYWWYH